MSGAPARTVDPAVRAEEGHAEIERRGGIEYEGDRVPTEERQIEHSDDVPIDPRRRPFDPVGVHLFRPDLELHPIVAGTDHAVDHDEVVLGGHVAIVCRNELHLIAREGRREEMVEVVVPVDQDFVGGTARVP